MFCKVVGTKQSANGYSIVLRSRKGKSLQEVALDPQVYTQILRTERKLVGRKVFLAGSSLLFPVKGKLLAAEAAPNGGKILTIQGKKRTYTVSVPASLYLKASEAVGGNPVGLRVKSFGSKLKFRSKGTIVGISKTASGYIAAIRGKTGEIRKVHLANQGLKLRAKLKGDTLKITRKHVKVSKPAKA
jgi:hypothetical protein